MPITLAKIIANTAKTTFVYDGEPVTAEYWPAKITEKTFAALQLFVSSADDGDIVSGFGSLNETLADIIKGWDVYEDDAATQMFPLDAARLAELPILFRVQALSAIIGDMRPETFAPTAAKTPSSFA